MFIVDHKARMLSVPAFSVLCLTAAGVHAGMAGEPEVIRKSSVLRCYADLQHAVPISPQGEDNTLHTFPCEAYYTKEDEERFEKKRG